MTGPFFVDTNVLVYFHDANFPEKQVRAAEWFSALWDSGAGRLSYQVLGEFYFTATQKLVPGLRREEARFWMKTLLTWDPVRPDGVVFAQAWAFQDLHQLSWWDSLIVSAAKLSGCRYLLTEDLQHEQDFGGLVVLNPFRTAPESF